jgi:hypothetical protein
MMGLVLDKFVESASDEAIKRVLGALSLKLPLGM